MSGVSGELGLNFDTDFSDTLRLQSRLAAGAYYFVADDEKPNLNSQFDLDLDEEDYDPLEGVRGSAGVSVLTVSRAS